MPANSSHILTVAVCLAVCLAAITSHAQYRTTYGGPSAGTYSFDGGIRQLRYNAIPNFSSAYDDYLQYLPAAVMAGMKAAGYESRTCWGRMLVSDAFSTAVIFFGSIFPMARQLNSGWPPSGERQKSKSRKNGRLSLLPEGGPGVKLNGGSVRYD